MDRTFYLFFYTFSLLILLPNLSLLIFAPYIVFTYYKKNFITCLWISLVCGMVMDLFTDNFRFGFHALIYCMVTFLLYNQKVHFFEEGFSTLPILTALFSVTFALVRAFIFYVISENPPFSWPWIENEFLFMPLCDSLYAMIAFSLPALFIPKSRPRQTRHFSLKESK